MRARAAVQAGTGLETVGVFDSGGKLTSVMTALPREDPVTGELHFFASSPLLPT
ncbi:hypothetical protein [Kitasatospora sp. P5_F3]